MGLDSIWRIGTGANGVIKAQKIIFRPQLNLVGGIFSGHGKGSFRGGYYNEFITQQTGVSLKQKTISNIKVKKISDQLQKMYWYIGLKKRYKISKQEFNDLRRMFKRYAKEGATLHGWWWNKW